MRGNLLGLHLSIREVTGRIGKYGGAPPAKTVFPAAVLQHPGAWRVGNLKTVNKEALLSFIIKGLKREMVPKKMRNNDELIGPFQSLFNRSDQPVIKRGKRELDIPHILVRSWIQEGTFMQVAQKPAKSCLHLGLICLHLDGNRLFIV